MLGWKTAWSKELGKEPKAQRGPEVAAACEDTPYEATELVANAEAGPVDEGEAEAPVEKREPSHFCPAALATKDDCLYRPDCGPYPNAVCAWRRRRPIATPLIFGIKS